MFGRKHAWREAGLEPPRYLFLDARIDTRLTPEQIAARLVNICIDSPCRFSDETFWGHPLAGQGRPFALLYKHIPFSFAYFGTVVDAGTHRRVLLTYAQPLGLVYIAAALLTFLVILKVGPIGFLTVVPIVLGIHVFRRLSFPREIGRLLEGFRTDEENRGTRRPNPA